MANKRSKWWLCAALTITSSVALLSSTFVLRYEWWIGCEMHDHLDAGTSPLFFSAAGLLKRVSWLTTVALCTLAVHAAPRIQLPRVHVLGVGLLALAAGSVGATAVLLVPEGVGVGRGPALFLFGSATGIAAALAAWIQVGATRESPHDERAAL